MESHQNTLFVHRDEFTVATYYDPNTKIVYMGIAKKNKKDVVYRRKLGNTIALGRALTRKTPLLTEVEQFNKAEIRDKVDNFLSCKPSKQSTKT
ncbi:MAG: hypothetical protein HGB12_17010 [Bacteroidetes bacterium]|nr:hypothetical protein [Bacteroidota bacterium]